MKLLTWLFHTDVKFCHANLIQRETTLLNEIEFDTKSISKTNALKMFPT